MANKVYYNCGISGIFTDASFQDFLLGYKLKETGAKYNYKVFRESLGKFVYYQYDPLLTQSIQKSLGDQVHFIPDQDNSSFVSQKLLDSIVEVVDKEITASCKMNCGVPQILQFIQNYLISKSVSTIPVKCPAVITWGKPDPTTYIEPHLAYFDEKTRSDQLVLPQSLYSYLKEKFGGKYYEILEFYGQSFCFPINLQNKFTAVYLKEKTFVFITPSGRVKIPCFKNHPFLLDTLAQCPFINLSAKIPLYPGYASCRYRHLALTQGIFGFSLEDETNCKGESVLRKIVLDTPVVDMDMFKHLDSNSGYIGYFHYENECLTHFIIIHESKLPQMQFNLEKLKIKVDDITIHFPGQLQAQSFLNVLLKHKTK